MKKLLVLAMVSFVMTGSISPALAGDGIGVLMPVKTRIIRCVTNEERIQMCQSENLCCNLPLVEEQTAATDTEEISLADNSATTLAPESARQDTTPKYTTYNPLETSVE